MTNRFRIMGHLGKYIEWRENDPEHYKVKTTQYVYVCVTNQKLFAVANRM